MRVSTTTVTIMLKRLAVRGLLDYTPRKGVRLTNAGEQPTLRIFRRQAVLERFLRYMLGFQRDKAVAEAERLEHAASDHLIEHLERLLASA